MTSLSQALVILSAAKNPRILRVSKPLTIAALLVLLIGTHPLLTGQSNPPAHHASTVPFVGCRSDGQVGPLDAPTGRSKTVPITHNLAQHLAYY